MSKFCNRFYTYAPEIVTKASIMLFVGGRCVNFRSLECSKYLRDTDDLFILIQISEPYIHHYIVLHVRNA